MAVRAAPAALAAPSPERLAHVDFDTEPAQQGSRLAVHSRPIQQP